ncbi:hypothetical protein KPL39_02055 [Clostridium gasigenes]|uniref:hypothetical protein n=1 Tax=Clostridium gasigenes TaxID=94869 RepID=UPI001C0E45A2|nr:hypothetical protein [Clostridium gasigenes]MBU3135044.1 hypothetical protein [Clostridium gasigenes]
MEYKKFTQLAVSSKFAICGIPLRVDTYKTCSFGCKYCFSNCRKIMEFEKTLQVGNMKWLEKKMDKVHNKGIYNSETFLDTLIKNKVTWHCGGMSDPFQPCENTLGITKQLIDISNEYNQSVLFSTKGNSVYGANINPNLHTFQLSITNIDDRIDLEPNVPSIESRYKFYRELKDNGFKVGIRMQPFIPNITNVEIIDMFKDADNFTIEGIKLVPQNKEHKDEVLKITGLNKDDFTQMGLLNLKPEIRIKLYDEFINKLKEYNIPYSIADNDLHYIGTNKCCCGDRLVSKTTNFNNTNLLTSVGMDYRLEDIKNNLEDYNDCKACQLFTSNRTEGCKTVGEFYDKRFDRASSPFSPKFQWVEKLEMRG